MSKMTKKNFKEFACIISSMTSVPVEYREMFAMNLAVYFKKENDNFDVYRFVNACCLKENNNESV